MKERLTLEEARRALMIDPDDLDTCLIEQAQLYHNVADAYELAIADRDAIKLELEELEAELDEGVRRKAARDEEKLTEGQIKAKLRTMPRISDMHHKYLTAKGLAGRWSALKESFDKRSFMLTKLVDRQIAQLNRLGIDRGMSNNKAALAEASLEYQKRYRRNERYGR